MTVEAFPALFEVSSQTFALTIACIVGARYAVRCSRRRSPPNLCAFLACGLCGFYCLYGEERQISQVDKTRDGRGRAESVHGKVLQIPTAAAMEGAGISLRTNSRSNLRTSRATKIDAVSATQKLQFEWNNISAIFTFSCRLPCGQWRYYCRMMGRTNHVSGLSTKWIDPTASQDFSCTCPTDRDAPRPLYCFPSESKMMRTTFNGLAGLTYWFNGIGGYNCSTFVAVTSSCLSVSNALTFVHLFILSEFLHKTNARYS